MRQFLEKQTQRFRQALFDLHGGGDRRKKMALRSEAAAAIAEKRQARAGSEHRRDDGNPGDQMEAMRFSLDHVDQRNNQRQSGGDG